ncbi:MAG TPA: WYL domain-containing protein [Nocardioides sp.]
MSGRRSERLMKLLIMLLVQRGFVSKARIREELYADLADGAFDRAFERDKDELRGLGVPVEVGSFDPLFDDELGYRVPAAEFALPEIALEPDEAAVLGVATQVWQSARLSDAARTGLLKLTAARRGDVVPGDGRDQANQGDPGDPGDPADLGVAVPRVGAEEPAFDLLVDAVHSRTVVEFDYRGRRDAAPTRRHLQPWGLVRYGSRWYAVGLDTDRDAERVFRLSRIVGTVRTAGRRDAFVPPADVDVSEVARRLRPPPPTGDPAVLLVRQGSGFALRRDATAVEPDVPGPAGAPGWDRVTLPWSGAVALRLVLEHGPDVLVEEPASLRADVVAALRAASRPVAPVAPATPATPATGPGPGVAVDTATEGGHP